MLCTFFAWRNLYFKVRYFRSVYSAVSLPATERRGTEQSQWEPPRLHWSRPQSPWASACRLTPGLRSLPPYMTCEQRCWSPGTVRNKRLWKVSEIKLSSAGLMYVCMNGDIFAPVQWGSSIHQQKEPQRSRFSLSESWTCISSSALHMVYCLCACRTTDSTVIKQLTLQSTKSHEISTLH